MAMKVEATAISDGSLIHTLSELDPEGFLVVSPDGKSLSPDPEKWRGLFKKYTGHPIPDEFEDAKKYFTDRVALTSKQIFLRFQLFAEHFLRRQTQKSQEGQSEPWRGRWHCFFPFDKHFSLTFTAQNADSIDGVQVFLDHCIYLCKDDGTDLRNVVHLEFNNAIPIFNKIQFGGMLPKDFAGLSSALSEETSAAEIIGGKLFKIFLQAVRGACT